MRVEQLHKIRYTLGNNAIVYVHIFVQNYYIAQKRD